MSSKSTRTAHKPAYRCGECGWTTAKWVGRCGECQAWGTVEETGTVTARTTAVAKVAAPAQRIAEVDASSAAYLSTGVDELDRVLGGGLVPGAVILLAGEPGVGKSTLLLDVAARFASRFESEHHELARTAGRGAAAAADQPGAATRTVPDAPVRDTGAGTGAEYDVLYVTGEESAAQVKLRAERIGAIANSLFLAAETDLGTVLGHIEALKPKLLIVDSVQTMSSAAVEGGAGGVTQIREAAASLIAAAKTHNMATILVGHVTKDGSIAGPRLLEHLVDVVCQFDGERHSRLRLIRAIKNRYGPTDEIGCFDLTEDGIWSLSDPSGLFVSPTKDPVAGTCITVTMEGRRPLIAEVQALLAESSTSQPRRATSGLDTSRVAMLLAVLQQRAKQQLHKDDSYVATVGGVKLTEPAVDLAVALALASAKYDKPLMSRLVAFGEVGLAGEVRAVPGIVKRIIEAERQGFTHAIIPASPHGLDKVPAGFKVREVATLSEALQLLF